MKIDLVGTPNFRDFGAQKSTVKGQTIGAGRLFRAGHLSELTAPDIESVRALELTHLFDLRRISEQSQYPNSAGVVESISCVLPLPIAPGHQHGALEALAEFASSPNDSHEFMCAMSASLVIFISLRYSAARTPGGLADRLPPGGTGRRIREPVP